jgi:hypothetical protein
MPSPNSSAPDHYLRRAHRRARSGLLLWALALAALATAVGLAPRLDWIPGSLALEAAHVVLVLAAALVLVFWIRRARRLDAASLARRLDAELSLSARLEASAELAADPSALAAAQRADAAQHLATRPAPPATAWFSALATLALALLLLLTQLSLLGYRSLRPAPDVALPAELPPDISASLTWQTPESEIKATAIEEIPLSALAATKTGLRDLTLEIAVNGDPRLSLPFSPETLAKLSAPGEHRLEYDLYLDEVGVQEFDLVSYHLRAQRDTPAPAPVVASPLQFIQIRPAREDALRMTGGPGASCVPLLIALKTAQLDLLKQNFLLAHAPLDRAETLWREENTRVGEEQTTLATRTAELRDLAIAEGMPPLLVDNLGLAMPLMLAASAQIKATKNEPAATPQGQALSLLVAAEKLLRKVVVEGGGRGAPRSTPPIADRFKDKQQFKLPPRAQTPAGELESLAQAQSEAAAEPAKDPLAEQAALAERLAKLEAAKSLDPAAREKAAQAARDAAEAARQLAAGDAEAARAPSAAAAQALREAAAAQEAAGLSAAQAELEKIRREINAAEHLADPAERAAALAAAAEKLRAEAAQQQETGSAAAAKELAQAAAKTEVAASDAGASPPKPAPPSPSDANSKAEGQGQGEGPGSGPKPPGSPPSPSNSPGSPPGSSLPSASRAAAQAQAALTPRDQALARAARQLNRAASPDTPAQTALTELELGADFASVLLADPTAEELVRILRDNTRRDELPAGNAGVIPENLRDPVARLIAMLEAARLGGGRDEQVRRFNPDDFDPAYRPAIEAYFEKLSRDAAK